MAYEESHAKLNSSNIIFNSPVYDKVLTVLNLIKS